MTSRTLIIGACGQIGTELTLALRARKGEDTVVASDIREGDVDLMSSGPFEIIDATNKEALSNCVDKYNISEVYLMAAMLSATAEKHPQKAWELNMNSLSHVLDLAREGKIKKVFWPSSIAVFGPTTPKDNTPQTTIMEPTTVYGISKLAGERWCEYFYRTHGVDVRSIRYPGLISWKTLPGGGTTDYAVEIYHKALEDGTYECFLSEDTYLPMMFMEDAINATISIMEAPKDEIRVRSSYNLGGISFSPKEIAASIKRELPNFTITYRPDFRQKIADSWPKSIDDSLARDDWGWEHQYELDDISREMLSQLKKQREELTDTID
ncbi:NAD-dependent epimerase/dehydratase family protein [Sungkyunkwania multivorans]|uniref:NAD-dependent epimerase/dehydratase family protein n=1 Tax=Sungkyunkwania multivorans TaxID=1173618 RepID=A0ABW3D1E2_9FLAO